LVGLIYPTVGSGQIEKYIVQLLPLLIETIAPDPVLDALVLVRVCANRLEPLQVLL
jgi:hypothetical protein